MIGKNIRKFRREKSMTQEQLAEKLNVTRQAVSNWENEKTQPDVDTLQLIAEQFDITMEDLIYEASEQKNTGIKNTIHTSIDVSTALGTALAVVISYTKWHSIGWAILHGMLNWIYVIYYVIKY